jgi:hypothetical protein
MNTSHKIKRPVLESIPSNVTEFISRPKYSSVIHYDRKFLHSLALRKIMRKGVALAVFWIFLGKRQMARVRVGKKTKWQCVNNGQIVFTYKEAEEKYTIKKGAFQRALDNLIEVGCIDIAQPGLSFGSKGIPTLYAISERWGDYGTAFFIEKKREKDKRQVRKRFPRPQTKVTRPPRMSVKKTPLTTADGSGDIAHKPKAKVRKLLKEAGLGPLSLHNYCLFHFR